MVAAYGLKLRTDDIFACPAAGYSTDAYLAYCHSETYGDYDHRAMWFGLEPELLHFAKRSKGSPG